MKSLAMVMALMLAAPALARDAVVVSSKLSSESAVLGHMIRLLLEANGIPTVDRMILAGTPIMRRALIAGEIDMYVEYTGNAAYFFNVATDPAWKDLKLGYALGAKLDYQAHRIIWLTPANATNTWALAVREDIARPNKLANSSTLRSLEKTYGFVLRPDQLIVLAGGDTSATIRAAAERTNSTNTAMVYGTDGSILAAHLAVLDDDRHDQPVYAPVPIIREAVLKAYPQIGPILKPLMDSFTQANLQELNARIQINGESPVSVAEDYLISLGMLPKGRRR